MSTIRAVLQQFLNETGAGNRRSTASPASIVELCSVYPDDYGHEDLNAFESARFEKEWRDDHRFCDMFGPDHSHPVREPAADAAADDHNDQFTIKQVEPDGILLESPLGEGHDLRIPLPGSVTAQAQTGWSVTLELARIKGRWRILGVGGVCP